MSEFKIGNVFSEAFHVVRRDPVAFLAIAFLVLFLPYMAINYGLPTTKEELARPFATPLWYVKILLTFLIMSLGFAALTRAAASSMHDRKVDIAACLTGALRDAPLLTLILLIYTVAAYLGLIFLIVPGIIISVLWFFVIPIAVLEKGNAFSSFGRSMALGSGFRWRILSLWLLMMLVALAFGFLGWVSMHGFTIDPKLVAARALESSSQVSVTFLLTQLATQVVTSFLVVLNAVAYQQLKRIKEGDVRVAEVFA
jgi:hypothetical protein